MNIDMSIERIKRAIARAFAPQPLFSFLEPTDVDDRRAMAATLCKNMVEFDRREKERRDPLSTNIQIPATPQGLPSDELLIAYEYTETKAVFGPERRKEERRGE